MAVNINGTFNINRNGGISINASSYPINLTIQESISGTPIGRTINSVTIGGGPAYIISSGTFPVCDTCSSILGHHFGGTSITVSESGNATIVININGIDRLGSCVSPVTGTATLTYTFTRYDQVLIFGTDCGG
jgi:hypothetical protein